MDDCIQKGFKTFNGQCYKECPTNTDDMNNDGICICSYFSFYDSENSLYICYGQDETCESKGYTKQIETIKQCFNSFDDCKFKGFKIFNNECYESCPVNTNDNDNNSVCSCSYFYYKDKNSDLYYCLEENEQCLSKGYLFKNNEEKQCFSSFDDCKAKEYKFFNDECPKEFPDNTYEKDSDQICYCSYFFYKNLDTSLYHCLAENEECLSKGYTKQIANIKQCFSSLDDCKLKGFKVFNNECYESCPENTYEKDIDSGVCYCLNYYFYNIADESLDCLSETETCESKDYPYKIEDKKQCFTSLDDCKAKGFYTFNNECYSSCPVNTKKNEIDNSICICENYYFHLGEQNKYVCFDSDKICITENEEYKYTNMETKECFKTRAECERKSAQKKCKYYENCEPGIDYMFNNICYKECPPGTKLDSSNPSSKNCICIENSEIDPISGLITCIDPKPDEHLTDFIPGSNDILGCPENTCLNPYENGLFKCVNFTEGMKVYNGICIFGIVEIINTLNLESNMKNIESFNTPLGMTLNIYPTKAPKDILLEKNQNLTLVDLGDCEDKLKAEYYLPQETKLYILGIDSPNIKGKSSINVFNYEIYLQNGTQLEDLSVCNDSKITTSSKINDLEIIQFEKGKEMSYYGYDIYDETSDFYVDTCAPAHENGNDITLEDRMTYYYPNINLCNDGCEYSSIDYDTQRIICECDITYNATNDVNNKTFEEEEDETYLEYLLSLINYKIFKCYSLFNDIENYYYNAGFYIGVGTLLISIGLICVFCIKTVNTIKADLFKNLPTKEKLKEIHKENMKRKSFDIDAISNISSNPPKKIMENNMNSDIESSNPKEEIDEIHSNENKIYIKNNKSKNYSKIEQFSQSSENDEKNNEKIEIFSIISNDNDKENNNLKKRNTVYLMKPSKTSKEIILDEKEICNSEIGKNNNELSIDFNFPHLIDKKDEDIKENELNEIPYQQALRIDKREFCQICLTVFFNKVGILNLFFFRSPYTYLTLTINVYLFELLLDLTFNCLLYSDDVVSEKYHNDGNLSFVTTFALSIVSNIISSIIVSIISNLTDYSVLLDAILIYVKNKDKFVENVMRLVKNIKIRLAIFHSLQILMIIVMTYYLFIFCTVYHYSQKSIMINYIVGALTSLAFSAGLTIIISLLRILSFKYKSNKMFNTSRYLYMKF